ncbi:uncharacterized protein LOC116602297 [Nematostella vectensis]|uniref:uncharacterized protein LOC116602297 n=1 Tax=Nematostella vectensis TaxID=45351 RepID=UPI00138FAC7A|nr:uncharacterized protein LOC116602297 [Nematostella vectensis]
MPVKQTKIHADDAPWVTADLKNLIKLRQKAFLAGDTERLLHYRNTVNRQRKTLRSRYFTSKVAQLRHAKPSQWWSAVKRVAGMTPASGHESVLSHLQLEGYNEKSNEQELANAINSAFLEPMEQFLPLQAPPAYAEDSTVLTVSESTVLSALAKLNPRKAASPDSIPNWILRDYAEILVQPITAILNCSFRDQRLPPSWRLTDVVPVH